MNLNWLEGTGAPNGKRHAFPTRTILKACLVAWKYVFFFNYPFVINSHIFFHFDRYYWGLQNTYKIMNMVVFFKRYEHVSYFDDK